MKKLFSFAFLTIFLCFHTAVSGYENVCDELIGNFQFMDCRIEPLPLEKRCSCRGNGKYSEKNYGSRPLIQSASESSLNPNVQLASGSSLNWSGYAALTNLTNPTKGSVSLVSGSWNIPQLSATNVDAYTAIWVGIDGFSNNTVEQIGTAHNWISGAQENYAWFEMYPGPMYEIVGFPIDIDDMFFASVQYAGNSIFTLTLVNITQGVYTVIPSRYTKSSRAQRSSAEWIVEAPSEGNQILPLSNFHTVAFGNCMATINGVSGSISNPNRQWEAISMFNSSHVLKALPSSLSAGGDAFSVTWEHD